MAVIRPLPELAADARVRAAALRVALEGVPFPTLTREAAAACDLLDEVATRATQLEKAGAK